MPETSHRNVFSVSFNALDRWDVAYFRSINWKWPKKYIRMIGEAISRIQELVNLNIEDAPIIEKISFGGDLTILEREKRSGYKGRLFRAKSGQLIYSKIRVKQGSVCIIPPSVDWVAVSAEYPVYEINQEIADAAYLDLVLRSSSFKHYLEGLSHGGSTKTRIHPNQFEVLSIPIPPLPVQRKIARYWKNYVEDSATNQNNIKDIESKSANDILGSSNIEMSMGEPLPKIFTTTLKQLERWGVDFNRHPWTLQNLIKSSKYKTVPLGDVAYVNPSTDLKIGNDDLVSFIPMEAVDDKDGHISKYDSRKLREVKSGYTRFQEGDVIWAKITPCMQNGKSAIAHNLTNGIGFGSTEFHVVRSKDTTVLKNEYIHLLLRLRDIRIAATRYFVGSAGQQRVPKEFLEYLHIPIPAPDIQIDLVNRVTEVRSQVSQIREEMNIKKMNASKEIEQMILGIRPVEEI